MKIRLLVAACSALGAVGCAPGLKHDIVMPSIPAIAENSQVAAGGAELLVNPFLDARPSATIVRYKGRDIKTQGEAAAAVEARVRERLERAGFSFARTAPLALSAELRAWQADVSSGFPADVQSKAAVYVEVRDPANKRIYSGEYTGMASMQHPNLSEDDIRQTLGVSMQQALNQLFADAQLMEILQSF